MKRLEQAEILLQIKLFYDSNLSTFHIQTSLHVGHTQEQRKHYKRHRDSRHEIRGNKNRQKIHLLGLRNEWGIGILKTNYGGILAAMTSQIIEILPPSLLWILR